MPRRDFSTILLLGSGPIVIGQACEFDYSGVQACRVLRREGYRVELIGAALATITLAEDRRAFADAMAEIGLDVAESGRATTVAEAQALAARFGYPLLVRSSFTLGGAGSGVAE